MTRAELKQLIKEEVRLAIKEVDTRGNPETFGELAEIITSIVKQQYKQAVKKGALSALIDQVASLIPGATNVKSALEFFKTVYNARDDKKTNSWLDRLNVDDDFSAIVDDSIENQFIKDLVEWISKQPQDARLPEDFDINEKLTAYLANKYNQRTLTGNQPQK